MVISTRIQIVIKYSSKYVEYVFISPVWQVVFVILTHHQFDHKPKNYLIWSLYFHTQSQYVTGTVSVCRPAGITASPPTLSAPFNQVIHPPTHTTTLICIVSHKQEPVMKVMFLISTKLNYISWERPENLIMAIFLIKFEFLSEKHSIVVQFLCNADKDVQSWW